MANQTNTLAIVNRYEKGLAQITDINDMRRVMSALKGLAIAVDREYKAAQTLTEGKEVRDDAYYAAVKVGVLRLKAEARLGELIRQEQEAGRLATRGQPKKSSTVATLKDYGLNKFDSHRAQQMAGHQDLIPILEAKAQERRGDIPTRKDFEILLKEIEGETQRNARQRVKLPDFLNDVNPIFYEFSVWEVPAQRPEGGIPTFRGNCSPYVCAGCLYNYSKVGDVVLDPMAGSGTFLDVSKAITDQEGQPAYSQIIASDLNPVRDDILQSDASRLSLFDNSVDFIFAHFPYWNAIDFASQSQKITARQPDETNDLSKMTWDIFMERSKAILTELFRVLKDNSYFCLMIGSKRENKYLCDLPLYLKVWGKDAGFMLYDEVLVMTYNPRKINFDSITGQRRLHIGKGRDDNALNICHDFILAFRKLDV